MIRGRVLIIEDDVDVAYLISEYLKRAGYTVQVAHDAFHGFDKVELFDPDLLVLDIMLPDMDGFSICKQIRATSSVPIIFLTARRERDEVITGLELGGDDYVTKPFEPDILVARVNAGIRRQQLLSSTTPIEHAFIESLTNREIETLMLLNRGYTNKEIAERLYISEGTVKGYNNVIYKKLDVRSRTQAITKAREIGIVS
ncbi:response regulator transcription factor [Geomicrobium sp. JCM 19039]|uniref:response regulator transcription factor n=1 Tax=Geomicrobium sp. JCM 19039 TaxID=1460636 RepID=UPI00045F4858|nr:response regulator transcription factor [Geomicrobium sp. JCM 19039]GAK12700.1 DNA-binding response regulator [Geomicrobium sp. JCM 19039]